MKTLQGDAIRNITGDMYFGADTNADTGFLTSVNGCFNGRNIKDFSVSRGGRIVGKYQGLSFNANNQISTANENRVNNFNIKLYIKV